MRRMWLVPMLSYSRGTFSSCALLVCRFSNKSCEKMIRSSSECDDSWMSDSTNEIIFFHFRGLRFETIIISETHSIATHSIFLTLPPNFQKERTDACEHINRQTARTSNATTLRNNVIRKPIILPSLSYHPRYNSSKNNSTFNIDGNSTTEIQRKERTNYERNFQCNSEG